MVDEVGIDVSAVVCIEVLDETVAEASVDEGAGVFEGVGVDVGVGVEVDAGAQPPTLEGTAPGPLPMATRLVSHLLCGTELAR